jgi:hypothetical protein
MWGKQNIQLPLLCRRLYNRERNYSFNFKLDIFLQAVNIQWPTQRLLWPFGKAMYPPVGHMFYTELHCLTWHWKQFSIGTFMYLRLFDLTFSVLACQLTAQLTLLYLCISLDDISTDSPKLYSPTTIV